MSVQDATVSFSLEVNVEKAYENIRRLQTVLYRALGLLRSMGLPEDVDAAIREIQNLIMILNQLRLTMIAVQAASGPIGWAMAGISTISTLMTTGEMYGDQLYDWSRGV